MHASIGSTGTATGSPFITNPTESTGAGASHDVDSTATDSDAEGDGLMKPGRLEIDQMQGAEGEVESVDALEGESRRSQEDQVHEGGVAVHGVLEGKNIGAPVGAPHCGSLGEVNLG